MMMHMMHMIYMQACASVRPPAHSHVRAMHAYACVGAYAQMHAGAFVAHVIAAVEDQACSPKDTKCIHAAHVHMSVDAAARSTSACIHACTLGYHGAPMRMLVYNMLAITINHNHNNDNNSNSILLLLH